MPSTLSRRFPPTKLLHLSTRLLLYSSPSWDAQLLPTVRNSENTEKSAMDEDQAKCYSLKVLKTACISALLIASALLSAASAQNAKETRSKPAVKGAGWTRICCPTSGLDLVIQQMTLEKKSGWFTAGGTEGASNIGSAAPATSLEIPRLGIPDCR